MEFIKPNGNYLDEYLSACKESYDNGVTEWMPVELDDFDGWKKRALRLYDMLESGDGLPAGIPKMITYWCVEDSKFVGEVQIRPDVTTDQAKTIGHIGYAVRYSMWGKGFGTKLLQFAAEKLREYQVAPIYIACHTGNAASNKVSQKAGFAFVEQRTVNGETENLYVLE